MHSLMPLASEIAARLIARKETIAVAESSTGGLIAAALLAVPGASAYFLGGAVVYTKASRAALLGIGDAEMKGLRPATEAYALLGARRVREQARRDLGLERNRRHRAERQPLWRCGRPHLHGDRRSRRARDHAGNRQRRSRREHGRLRQARA